MALTVNFKKNKEEELDKKIQNGVSFLDKKVGCDWYNRIDLEELDMSNPFCCIIGQMFGSYNSGKVELDLSIEESRSMAFNIIDSIYSRGEYGTLSCQWKRAITSIREERNKK